jgi:hypothetical protein
VVGIVLGGAFYLLLIDTLDLPELFAGAGATVLAALAFEATREQGFAEMAVRPAMLARIWRPLARVPPDVARVSFAALAQLLRPRRRRGTLRAFDFQHGGPGRATDAARRALAESAGSLAPNTIVIGVDPERNLILAHQLRREGSVDSVDVLGLR